MMLRYVVELQLWVLKMGDFENLSSLLKKEHATYLEAVWTRDTKRTQQHSYVLVAQKPTSYALESPRLSVFLAGEGP
jgi:hypothetical protein